MLALQTDSYIYNSKVGTANGANKIAVTFEVTWGT
jgi:hypothetical protein